MLTNRIAGLFEKEQDYIKDTVWYRQRFDACPHFMFFLGDAHTSNLNKTKYPYAQRIAYSGFSNNRADWYHSLPDLEKTAQSIIGLAKDNPNISSEMVADFQHWEDDFYRVCLEIKEKKLSSLSNDELIGLYRKLEDIYTDKLNCSPLIDGFSLSTDALVALKIKDFLSTIDEGDNFAEYFSILTAPIFLSFLQAEEIELLKLVAIIKESPDKQAELIRAHQNRFFWIQNNYVKDNVLSEDYFNHRVSELLTKDVEDEINRIQLIPTAHLDEKTKLVERLNFPREIRTLLKITDDFNAWQDERKKGTFWATHYFSKLLDEATKRTHYNIEELKYSLPPEFNLVINQQIDKQELQQRIEYCMIVWADDAYDVITDLEYIKELDEIGTGKKQHTKELKGFAASLGKVIGPVRVVESVEEISKVREGDILVAVMTRPDYLPAMKRAAAFVTDEGGITCHAAIVAREMKKPCVIATKIATKILHDDEMVEVDANKGEIRVIDGTNS